MLILIMCSVLLNYIVTWWWNNKNLQSDNVLLYCIKNKAIIKGQLIDNRKKSSKNVPDQHKDHYIIAANHVLCKLLIT